MLEKEFTKTIIFYNIESNSIYSTGAENKLQSEYNIEHIKVEGTKMR